MLRNRSSTLPSSVAVSTAAAFFVLALGVAAWLLFGIGGTANETPAATEALADGEKTRLAAEAAITHIAAESREIDTAEANVGGGHPDTRVATVAPPGFTASARADHDASPPDGYSFPSWSEAERMPVAAASLDPGDSPAEPPEWMAYGPDELVAKAVASGRDWTFGWIKLAGGADLDALRDALGGTGGAILGQSGDLVRVRLPGDPARLRAIAAAEPVAGMGAVPVERKVTETLLERAVADAAVELPVWITLMADDPDGRWRRELKYLGAEVGAFDPAIRTYAAIIGPESLRLIAEADWVLAVETIGRVETTLEIAAPAMGADAVHAWDASAGAFTGVGGASVTVGVMDTGLNIGHPDISSNRRSICGANFANHFDPREEDQDLWLDGAGHGTHVTGIALGNGAGDRHRAGMAPLVRDIRFAKAVSSFGSGSALGWNRALDWLATPTACADGVPRKALVINSSLGVTRDAWEGRSNVERKIDASVWNARQLVVTSAGNSAQAGSSSMGNAKNALAVGAAQNVGDIAGFSSRGPTGDGRLMPKIVGTGVDVASAMGGGASDGYVVLSGTSMSSPSVAGVAALVMDAVPELGGEPAALRARLMASAIKPDAFMGDPSAFPLDNTNGPGTQHDVYGLGKVSARTAVLDRDAEDGWTGAATAFDADPDGIHYVDIVVTEGASRLDVVLTWDEPPSDTIANTVLNDLDLWVDSHASCGSVPLCGEFQSRSRIDNVEWVVVPNPEPGIYRLKSVPTRIYGETPRAGLAWTVIRGASTPALAMSAQAERMEVAAGADFDVDVTLTTDGYVAAGAKLRVDCRTAPGSTACDGLTYAPGDSTVQREDGLERSLARDGTTEVVVGEIGPDEEQTISLRFEGRPESAFTLHVSASAWNAAGASTSVAVVVGTPEDEPAPVRRPSNDDFSDALVLDGTGGETDFDLIAATPEPGEPAYPFLLGGHPYRTRTLWYAWTAPESGLARFSVAPAMAGDYADYVVVEVFRNDSLAGLEVAFNPQIGGGSTFFATEGETYRVRLTMPPYATTYSDAEGGNRQIAMPRLTLGWGPATRPANDAYAMASAIVGESGTVDGTNQGATTEPGELMGDSDPTEPDDDFGWSGSVWYTWTAPSTGDFAFAVDRRTMKVAAFVGDDIEATRMVSGVPETGPETIVFPAAEGVEYRIGVATRTAYWSGAEFALTWEPGERSDGNDDFAAASLASGDFAYGTVDFDVLTVEHGEPNQSGVRTAWWKWQPSVDGRHTWRVTRISGFSRTLDEAPLQMSVFEGDELASLVPVGLDRGTGALELELAFDAAADRAYHVALGLPRDAAQTPLPLSEVMMEWGATPPNDDFADAMELAAAGGSVIGSNEFATTEPGERTGTLGDSTLWWTLSPAETQWMRFEVDGPQGSRLVIYEIGADGGLELVAVSREFDVPAIMLRAEAGVRYVLRYGTYYCDADGCPKGRRGTFELKWGPADAPALLRAVDSLVDGQIADDGSELRLGRLGNQTLNAEGTELYAASDRGILVFARDVATGRLTLTQTLAEHPVHDPPRRDLKIWEDPGTQLIWDEAGNALLVTSCDGWSKFSPQEGGGIEFAGRIDGAPCPTRRLLALGDFVHNVKPPWMIETFRFDETRDALTLTGVNLIPDVTQAVATPDGLNVYAATHDGVTPRLLAAERDPETGKLGITTFLEEGSETAGGPVEGLTQQGVRSLATNGSHLFASVYWQGQDILVFDLAERGNPSVVGYRPPFRRWFHCMDIAAWRDIAAVDFVCELGGTVFAVYQVGQDGSVFPTDLLITSGRHLDVFGNTVPTNRDLRSMSTSPDGRHLYVAGYDTRYEIDPSGYSRQFDVYRMLVFERVYDPVSSAEDGS